MGINIDNKFKRDGFKVIAGVDEAGRGAWAGPLVAAAVIMPNKIVSGITDSKKISERKREQLFPLITKQALCWAVVSVNQNEIDTLGVHEANKLALSYAITHLDVVPDIVLVDGFKIEHFVPTEQVIGGDAKSYNIGAASIIAKVVRDRLMRRFDMFDGRFVFAKHKGYGTKYHEQQLEIYKPHLIHRKSFAPIQRFGI
ncbi:MAG: ribonuclease HII [bacterium]|nr:ribonuclease HII [bacterium]